MSEYEKQCIDMYLRIHVSKLATLSDDDRKMWCRGQDLYRESKHV